MKSPLDIAYEHCSEEIKRKYPDPRDQIKAHKLQLDIAIGFAQMESPMDPADPMLPDALRLLASSLEYCQQEGGTLYEGRTTRHGSVKEATSSWD